MILIRYTLNNLSIPVKAFANNIIEFPKLIFGYIDIQKENKKLRFEIDDLRMQSILVDNMKKELKELKKLLNINNTIPNFKAVEKVLGYEKSFYYESFLLISSTSPETRKWNIVVSKEGLVGIIHEVHGNIARVTTVVNNKLSIPVISNSGERMILSGNGEGKLESLVIHNFHVSEKLNLKIGDILHTSGEGGLFRSNIPVAKIDEIDQINGKITASPCSSFDLSFVLVMDAITHTTE
jgi:rod shape-determining protein MreC